MRVAQSMLSARNLARTAGTTADWTSIGATRASGIPSLAADPSSYSKYLRSDPHDDPLSSSSSPKTWSSPVDPVSLCPPDRPMRSSAESWSCPQLSVSLISCHVTTDNAAVRSWPLSSSLGCTQAGTDAEGDKTTQSSSYRKPALPPRPHSANRHRPCIVASVCLTDPSWGSHSTWRTILHRRYQISPTVVGGLTDDHQPQVETFGMKNSVVYVCVCSGTWMMRASFLRTRLTSFRTKGARE